MSAALTLADPDHLERLIPLMAAFHAEEGLEINDTERRAAVSPLLSGHPLGAVYLIGPPRAPIGYIVICFGWSIEFGGIDGFVDEFFVRPGVRGRGIGAEVLHALPKALAAAGVKALHLEVDQHNTRAQRLYGKAGFALRDRYHLMTRRL